MSSPNEQSDRERSAIRNYPRLLKRYARLLEVTSDLASTLELDILLHHIVDAAQELTGSAATSLLLYNPESGHLYFEAATAAINDEILGRAAVPIEGSIAGWIFSNCKPLLVEDALRDPRFFREVDVVTEFQTRTILGVPLRTKDKTLGVIEAINKTQGAFDEEDLRILQSLAAQAAIAIENSRLFQQSDFIAEIMHELRTPLGALTAAAHLLQRPDLPKEQQNKLSRIVFDEVQRLNDLTSDFLDLSRLESGRARFVREPVYLEGLIHECIEIIRPQVQEEQIEIYTDLERSLAPVQGDRNRLKQVLLNLLTNAIKYNHPGGKINMRLYLEDDMATLSVEDTGEGIPSDSLPRIFERFYRVPDPTCRIAGTGLGLAIARRIVNSHDGTIKVESEYHKGSTFTVRLPISLTSYHQSDLHKD